jgi:hypothetical protein
MLISVHRSCDTLEDDLLTNSLHSCDPRSGRKGTPMPCVILAEGVTAFLHKTCEGMFMLPLSAQNRPIADLGYMRKEPCFVNSLSVRAMKEGIRGRAGARPGTRRESDRKKVEKWFGHGLIDPV